MLAMKVVGLAALGVSTTYTMHVGCLAANMSVMMLPEADHVNTSICPGVSTNTNLPGPQVDRSAHDNTSRSAGPQREAQREPQHKPQPVYTSAQQQWAKNIHVWHCAAQAHSSLPVSHAFPAPLTQAQALVYPRCPEPFHNKKQPNDTEKRPTHQSSAGITATTAAAATTTTTTHHRHHRHQPTTDTTVPGESWWRTGSAT
jgi:hypothetical protein